MNIQFDEESTKEDVFVGVEAHIGSIVRIADKDTSRPWGGFLVIDEADAEIFIKNFFPELTKEELSISGKLSPKILIVAPNKKLSWQYHHRRAEVWRLINGTAGVVRSDDDTEKELTVLEPGDKIELQQGERHRLVGLNGWGIVAEIWRHTDAENPSDEDDIVRVQDDFGR
ncbi:MAG: phosphoheptose isomerase [Sphingobacteriales bacterium]|nr:MAG: phosphoheptose isomerase [Sphingobacteriales bacterium]